MTSSDSYEIRIREIQDQLKSFQEDLNKLQDKKNELCVELSVIASAQFGQCSGVVRDLTDSQIMNSNDLTAIPFEIARTSYKDFNYKQKSFLCKSEEPHIFYSDEPKSKPNFCLISTDASQMCSFSRKYTTISVFFGTGSNLNLTTQISNVPSMTQAEFKAILTALQIVKKWP